MNQNDNENQTDEEIENDFNPQNSVLDKNNFDFDNELTEYLQETINNSKRENETSGISILKELEDKWESIERQKKLNNQSTKSKKKNVLNNINQINKKAMIDNMKNKFLRKVKISRDKYNNNKEFELYANEVIAEMDKRIIQYEGIKEQLIKENKMRDDSIQKQSSKNDYNRDNGNRPNQSKPNREKTFLLPESPINNERKRMQDVLYNRNPFNSKTPNSIDNLVYETPNYTQYNSNDNYENNYAISTSLANKLKSVFNDITQPNILPKNQQTTTNNEFQLNVNKEQQLNNVNRNEGDVKQSLLRENEKYDSLYSLERNFDEIISKLNPKINNRLLVRKVIINKGGNENEIINEEDRYFESLKEEIGFKKQKSNNIQSDRYKFTLISELADRKFSKKMEENMKLLNNVMKNEDINKKKYLRNYSGNKINQNKLNVSFLRNHSVSLLNNTNSSSMMQDNRIFAKNKFDDTLSKIYQANALKIQKIINSK